MMLKKNLMMLWMLVSMTMVAVAQTAVTAVPYYCDFEDYNENQNWTLNRRGGIGASTPLPSNWTIGTGAKHSGLNGLYIYSGDATEAAEYNGSREVFVVAERTFSLQPGTYDLAFDWRCLGDESSDAIFVYWVPSTVTLNSRTNSTLPTNATPLTIDSKTYLSGSATWTQSRTTVTVNNAQPYRLVFAWRNNTTNTYNPGGCLDNVQLHQQETATDCWHTVTNMKWTQGQTADVLSWRAATNTPGVTYDIYYWLEGSIQVDSIMGVTTTSCTFPHGMLLSGMYTFAIRTNCGDNESILLELLNVKSLGDFSMVAEACPEVTLVSNDIFNGEKYLRPSCDESGHFNVKPMTVAGGGSIAGYRVDPIDYNDCPFPFDLMQLPPQYRNAITTITRDDYWDTQLINLPFAVCFFDGTYRQALVGANGLVTFDPSIQPNSTCAWSLTSQPDVPSREFQYKNCIMGVYQDYYPVPSAGGLQQIWYGVLGEWPCRKMVVCFNEVPMFNNHSTINSSMIVMYEGTNVIDVYVKNRDLSPSGWNDNRGIIGIINADGSDGVAAPGRNTNDGDNNRRAWSAKKEAWRFTPYSTPTFKLTWYKGAFTVADSIDAYIRNHPEENIELAVSDSLIVSKEDGVDAVTVRLQYSQCNGDYIDIIDHARIKWPRTDTIRVDASTCAGRPYNDRYINRAEEEGLHQVVIPDSRGCDSIVYQLNLKVLPVDTASMDTTLCEGQILDYGGLRVNVPGTYPIKKRYASCDCDSVLEYVTLNVFESLQAGVTDFPDQICADDSLFTFGLESSMTNVTYSLRFEPANSGLRDVHDREVQRTQDVTVRIPKSVVPGNYTMYLDMSDNGCGAVHDTVHFTINYAASIAPQKWNNVLVLLDTPQNGGYTFDHIQWYRNGTAIFGENGPYLYLGEGTEFSPNDVYTVGLTRTGETVEIQSCYLGDFAAMTGNNHGSSRDAQLDPNQLPEQLNGRMIMYDMMGMVLMNEAYDYQRLMQTVGGGRKGVYLVKVVADGEQQVYRLCNK